MMMMIEGRERKKCDDKKKKERSCAIDKREKELKPPFPGV
jgi:hypothetical protein